MELPVALPDATVLAVRRSPLPDRHPADAFPPAQRASDAWAAAPPDEAADAVLPALAAARYAEKLAVPVPAVPALLAEPRLPWTLRTLPLGAKALCKPDAAPSAA